VDNFSRKYFEPGCILVAQELVRCNQWRSVARRENDSIPWWPPLMGVQNVVPQEFSAVY
jgi:hypothetical protein